MLNAIGLKISRYTAAVFRIPIFARAFAGLGIIACNACVNVSPRPDAAEAPEAFYTVTAEIALSRHQPRVAALEYAAAAENDRDVGLLQRAAEVTADCLQPSLTGAVAARWIDADPASLAAHRAAAQAALALYQIERAAVHYRVVLSSSPEGLDAEFKSLETELSATDNVYGARQLADRLVAYFPDSTAAVRVQAFAALRADDPAAAARSFNSALAATSDADARRMMTQALQRARILAGDKDQSLEEARTLLATEESSEHRLDYALLLLAAQDAPAARAQLAELTHDMAAAPAALRLLGLIDIQEGRLDDAALRFAELATTGKFLDDALYYLASIAERRGDQERALRLYAQVQTGENAVPALLHAAGILHAHGAAPEADDLLDRLVEEAPARAPEILASRARMYQQSGDLARAADTLERGTLEYPDNVDLRYATASLYEENGQLGRALRELKAVVKLRPDDPAAVNAYAYTLADHDKHLQLARRLIETAHAAAPKNAAILDSYGWVLFRQGQGERALTYLNEAYAGDRSGDLAAHLGEVLWRLGRETEARRIWEEGAQVDAENLLLKSTRSRLHASN
jgi:tetratricopeptide (TPR) repeat protein